MKNTQGFKALLAQTEAELRTRGLDVVPVGVRNVLAHAVNTVAERMDIQPRSALRYIDPAVMPTRSPRPVPSPPPAPKGPTASAPSDWTTARCPPTGASPDAP